MKILVPINFGESSLNALEYAMLVAQTSGHSVTTLHVVSPQKVPTSKLAHRMLEIQREEDLAFHKTKLGEFIPKLSNPSFQFEDHLVRRGDMAKRILIESMDEFDLVVIGTRGGSKLVETFLGSGTYSYLKIAIKPTIVVPQGWPSSRGITTACLSLKFDNLYSSVCSQLIEITKSLGYHTELLTVVDSVKEDLAVVIQHQGVPIPVEIYAGKKPIKVIKKHIKKFESGLLALHFNIYSLVTSLTEQSASQEFTFRSQIPILFVK